MHLIVTRPLEQAGPWVAELQAAGVDAVALPLLRIAPLDDRAPLEAAWRQLAAQSFVMFVSANAVQHFFAARPAGATWPASLRAGATGPGTRAALLAAGLEDRQVVWPDPSAGRFDSEALWQRIADEPWAGREVLVVRGEEGRDWLAERWRERGANVGFVAAYRRLPPILDAAATALLEQALGAAPEWVWHFSSSEALRHLAQARPHADWSHASALATHERIARSARALGFGRVLTIGPATPDAVQALRTLDAGPGSVQSRGP